MTFSKFCYDWFYANNSEMKNLAVAKNRFVRHHHVMLWVWNGSHNGVLLHSRHFFRSRRQVAPNRRIGSGCSITLCKSIRGNFSENFRSIYWLLRPICVQFRKEREREKQTFSLNINFANLRCMVLKNEMKIIWYTLKLISSIVGTWLLFVFVQYFVA